MRLIAATLGSLLVHAGLMVFLGEPPRAANPEIPPRIALRLSESPLPEPEPEPPVPPSPTPEMPAPVSPTVEEPPLILDPRYRRPPWTRRHWRLVLTENRRSFP